MINDDDDDDDDDDNNNNNNNNNNCDEYNQSLSFQISYFQGRVVLRLAIFQKASVCHRP